MEYKRLSGRILTEDTVKIPAAGGSSEWVTETFDGAVEIFNHADWIAAVGQQSDPLQAGRGFFGGDAELTWQLLKPDESPLGDEQKMLFRIAGKNPDDGLCREYIDEVAQSLLSESGSLMWYAYAIAKSETKGLGGDSYYNQFLRRGDKCRDKKGSEGRPNWNNDSKEKPGGFVKIKDDFFISNSLCVKTDGSIKKYSFFTPSADQEEIITFCLDGAGGFQSSTRQLTEEESKAINGGGPALLGTDGLPDDDKIAQYLNIGDPVALNVQKVLAGKLYQSPIASWRAVNNTFSLSQQYLDPADAADIASLVSWTPPSDP